MGGNSVASCETRPRPTSGAGLRHSTRRTPVEPWAGICLRRADATQCLRAYENQTLPGFAFPYLLFLPSLAFLKT